ncbi:hypothetical protein KAJ38_02720 [Candidatus Pacearchaeota archaeon]|nr:hypothetical protein [Candidatus Pacearchaeota archaeon]
MELRKINRGQMEIQQMAFMILAVFLFFILVGLFFLGIQFKDIKKNVAQLQTEQAISSLKVIADMPELNYDSHESMTLDEDKLRIMSGNLGTYYSEFWPVASVKVYKIYPKFNERVKCPALNCNYFEIYDNGQESMKTYSTYVSICKKVKETGYIYDRCEVGKLVVGVITNEAKK